MKISKFNTTLLYSHKNMEKMLREFINESSNAVLLECFDDVCILADHKTGKIYECKYSFDGETVSFEDFSKIELERDNTALREAISNFFDDSNSSNLVEAFEESNDCSSDVLESSLAEALASKNIEDTLDYSELAGINEEIGDFKDSKLFKIYENRLDEKPLNYITSFDWVNPVKVSLIDEDEENVHVTGIKIKANLLKNNVEFKNDLCEAIKESLDGDTSELESLLESNHAIVALDSSELKELVGLATIGEKRLVESRNEILKIVNETIDSSEFLSDMKLACEECINEEEDDDAEETACSEKDYKELRSALEKAADVVTDENLLKKINDLIDNVEDCMETSTTDVKTVKECIALLRM